MKIQTCVGCLLKLKDITKQKFAKMNGITQQAMCERFNKRKDWGFQETLDMLDLLGYEIIVRKADTGRRREDEIVITREDEVIQHKIHTVVYGEDKK